MPSIAELVAKNSELTAAGKKAYVDAPETPQAPQGPMPAIPTVSGLPIRGVFSPTQILDTDFSNTTKSGSAPMRSAIFPPQANPTTIKTSVVVGGSGGNGGSSAPASSLALSTNNALNPVQGSINFIGQGGITIMADKAGNEIFSVLSDSFAGAWNSATSYVTGQIVNVGSALYIALQNNSNENPTSTSGFWQTLTGNSVYEGAWSNTTAYQIGETVSYVDGNFYICIVANTGVPPLPVGSVDWVLLGTSNTLIGAYSGAVTYIAGNQVTNAGFIFQALQTTTGNAPPTPPATSAFWINVGPASIDPSTSYVLAKGSMPPSLTNSWAFATTSTTITLYSNPALINRADGTFVNLGFYSQAITGLTASTSYQIYPYYNESTGTIQLVGAPGNLATTTGVTFGASGFAVTSSTVTTPTAFSIEFWFKSTQTIPIPIFSASGAINSGTGIPTNPCFSINISSANVIQVVFKTTASYVTVNFTTTNTPVLNDGNWHHVALGFHPASTAAAYAVVDGTIYVATPVNSFVPPAASVVYGIGVGFDTTPSTLLATTTTIGPVAFWATYSDYAANGQSLYRSGVMQGSVSFIQYVASAAPTAPTSLWPLNETSGTTLHDTIGSNNATLDGTNTLNVSSTTVNAMGSPAAAWNVANIVAAALQNSQGNIPLTSAGISITTPASGSGGSAQGGNTTAAVVGRNNALL